MIAFIDGTVVEKSEGEAIVMTAGGVGYRLMCSMNTLSSLPAAGDKCRLYTHLNVREDAMELYGFLQTEEREMFRRLIAISGIGARSALQILGSMPLSNLRLAILTGDVAALSRAPGIGKKTAQRISLELKDKLAKEALSGADELKEIAAVTDSGPQGAGVFAAGSRVRLEGRRRKSGDRRRNDQTGPAPHGTAGINRQEERHGRPNRIFRLPGGGRRAGTEPAAKDPAGVYRAGEREAKPAYFH